MPILKRVVFSFKKTITWFKKASWKKRLFIAFVLFLFFFILLKRGNSNKENGYVFDIVKHQNITEAVLESGNITTAGITKVYSPATGIVEEIYVQNGDLVGIGQELFRVKSTATPDEVAQAYASLAAAQNSLKTAEQAKLTLQSSLEQARKGVLSAQQAVDDMKDARIHSPDVYTQNEIDSIDSTLTSARQTFSAVEKQYVEADTAINAARAALTSSNLHYQSTQDRTVTSPTIGTVSNLSVSVGSSIFAGSESVTAVSLTSTVTPALTIANFSSNQVVLAVNETDITKIKVGQSATIEPDALNDLKYKGKVKRVDSIGHDSGGIIVYNVYIDILAVDTNLRSGMTVDVDIITNRLNNVLAVKNTAIKPYQGGRAVRVLNSKTGEVEYLPVTVGIKGSEYTQITKGVKEGQKIIVSLSNEKIQRGGPFSF
jgi:HlyD family secretion protein